MHPSLGDGAVILAKETKKVAADSWRTKDKVLPIMILEASSPKRTNIVHMAKETEYNNSLRQQKHSRNVQQGRTDETEKST